MILGIDIGTGVTKGALLKDGEFIWGSKTDTEANPIKAVEKIFENLNNEKNIHENDVTDVVLTGWGQTKVSGRKSNELVNSISRGALWADPSVKSVLSMGSQESIVIKINVADFNIFCQPGNSFCPLGKLCLGVTTGVETLTAVEPDIDEIAGSNQRAAQAWHVENAQPNIVSP